MGWVGGLGDGYKERVKGVNGTYELDLFFFFSKFVERGKGGKGGK